MGYKLAVSVMLACLLLVSWARAQFEIPWWKMDGGGGMTQDSGFELLSAIGQSDAGVLSGDGFELQGGFLVPDLFATPTPTATPVVSYSFEGTMDGWTFTPVALNTYDIQCTGATSSYDNHAIGTTTDDVASRFGFWEAPGSVPYQANMLYKFAWRTYTSQPNPAVVPTFRFRINEATNFSYDVEMVLTSVTGDFMPPSMGTRTYNQYVLPIYAGPLLPSFDVFDFDAIDEGTVFVDQLDVYLVNLPVLGWIQETPPAFGTWSWSGAITPYDPLVSGTSGGLRIISTMAESRGFGFWTSPLSAIAWTPNQIYSAGFTISSVDAAPMLGGVRVGSNDFNWMARLRFYALTAPDAGGKPYPLYFEDASGTTFFLVYEGMDFENFRGGTNLLTTVGVERHDPFF